MLIIFTILFFVGVIGASVLIVRKVPLVLATPRQIIDDYFLQSSQRFHVRALRAKGWFQKGEYRDPLLGFLLRVLRWTRILLMRLERKSSNLIEAVNGKYEAKRANGNVFQPKDRPSMPSPQYWNELKTGKEKAEDKPS
ncbi:MAG: hypothetical protein HY220_00855 [Candidatus Sungbacteria bacterium]|uniref:Uncharacterized protein n=1 Tax=Candidatus Sungiibacteriota bacterium TaxID=2750080 RepID=A0A9D6LPI8_9BACT|nr:hypothetical protein [Candidatus Sungbacteria bacterium]